MAITIWVIADLIPLVTLAVVAVAAVAEPAARFWRTAGPVSRREPRHEPRSQS